MGVLLAADDTARLGEIAAPTLILWGERDALLPRGEQGRHAEEIPDATLRVHAETGRAVTGERPGVGRTGFGGVHEGHTSRLILSHRVLRELPRNPTRELRRTPHPTHLGE